MIKSGGINDSNDDTGRDENKIFSVSPPSLLEPQSSGGENAQRGFSFQESYILASICEWLSQDGFTSMITEGIGDTEASFFVPGKGYKKELIEVKNHSLTPSEFWNEIKRFQQVEAGSPGTYRKFVLAATGVSRELEPVLNGLERVRGPQAFYGSQSPIFEKSLNDFSDRVEKLGQNEEVALFLFEKVKLVTGLAIYQSQGEALFKQALIEHLPGYLDLPVRMLEDIYPRLSSFVDNRKNTTITRSELEAKFREKINSTQLPPLRPVEFYTLSQLPTTENNASPSITKGLLFNWVDFAGNNGIYPLATVWNNQLLRELVQTRDWMLSHRTQRRIRLTSIRRISASLAIGSIFSAVRGFFVEMEYRGEIYAADAHPDDTTPEYNWAVNHRSGVGDRLIVSIGVPRQISDEVEVYMDHRERERLPAIHLYGTKPFVSPQHANRAVGRAKEIIIKARSDTNAKKIELFVASPDYFALFLGHRLNAIAPTQCYQYVSSGQYTPTCLL
jgi:hypothetical protein